MGMTRHAEAAISPFGLRSPCPQNPLKLPSAPKRGPPWPHRTVQSRTDPNNTQPVISVFVRECTRANTLCSPLLDWWREEQSTKQASTTDFTFTEFLLFLFFFLVNTCKYTIFSAGETDHFTFFNETPCDFCFTERTVQLGPITVLPSSQTGTRPTDSITALSTKNRTTWDSG